MHRKPATAWVKFNNRRTLCTSVGYEWNHIYRMLHPQGKIMRVSSVTESNLGEEMEIYQPTEHTTEQLGSILPHPIDIIPDL